MASLYGVLQSRTLSKYWLAADMDTSMDAFNALHSHHNQHSPGKDCHSGMNNRSTPPAHSTAEHELSTGEHDLFEAVKQLEKRGLLRLVRVKRTGKQGFFKELRPGKPSIATSAMKMSFDTNDEVDRASSDELEGEEDDEDEDELAAVTSRY